MPRSIAAEFALPGMVSSPSATRNLWQKFALVPIKGKPERYWPQTVQSSVIWVAETKLKDTLKPENCNCAVGHHFVADVIGTQ